MYVVPFMAYFIFHELWIYPNSMMHMMGFRCTNHFQYQVMFWVYETIGKRGKFDVGGGQGGIVNALRDVGRSSPKLGISWMNESFGILMVELYSTLWSVSMHEVSLAFAPRKVCSPSGFATLFTCCFIWRIGILLIMFLFFLCM